MKLEDIKTGGFYFYTERYYETNDADTLMEVRGVNGVDMAHPIATNWRGAYINETPNNWGDDLPVATCYDKRCWHSCDYTREDGNPALWMAENYPLDNNNQIHSESKEQTINNMSEHNTPETDAEIKSQYERGNTCLSLTGWAKQLERERDELRDQLRKMVKAKGRFNTQKEMEKLISILPENSKRCHGESK